MPRLVSFCVASLTVRAVKGFLAVTSCAASLAGLMILVECGGPLQSEGYPQCDPEAGIECPPVPCTASKVIYHCQFAGTPINAFDVPVCLPSNLNLAIASGQEQAAINAMCDAGTYDKAVFDYGQQVLHQTAALFALDTNGRQDVCSFINMSLTDAGVGEGGGPNTYCQPLTDAGILVGTSNISFCEDAGNLVPSTCCPTPSDKGLCVPNPCIGFAGQPTINPHGCPCNTVPADPAECFIEAGTVVIPSAGQGDPPGESSGLLQRILSAASTATMFPNSSYAKAHLHFTDHLGFGKDDTQTSQLSGTATVYGGPRDDGTATIYFDAHLNGTDIHFHFSNVDIFGSVDVFVTNITIALGAGDNTIQLDSSGWGTIAKQQLAVTLEAYIDKQKTIVRKTNDSAMSINVNFGAKTFTMPAFMLSPFGADVTVALSGSLTNQPPFADAGAAQTVECTSPQGTNVTLGGKASDPDNETLIVSWLRGPPVSAGEISLFNKNLFVGDTPTLNALAPFSPPTLTTGFTLLAQDHTLQTSLSQTTVTVQDTTPPVLVLGAPQPECLWAPNHKIVLYELGKQLPFVVKDPCDTNPTVEIFNLTSNQPDLGGGQGDFTPDFARGKGGLCLRSERQGTVMWDREYTITVQATDASKNTVKKMVVVRVPHDQSGAAKCPNIEPARYVDITDPRCTEN